MTKKIVDKYSDAHECSWEGMLKFGQTQLTLFSNWHWAFACDPMEDYWVEFDCMYVYDEDGNEVTDKAIIRAVEDLAAELIEDEEEYARKA